MKCKMSEAAIGCEIDRITKVHENGHYLDRWCHSYAKVLGSAYRSYLLAEDTAPEEWIEIAWLLAAKHPDIVFHDAMWGCGGCGLVKAELAEFLRVDCLV